MIETNALVERHVNFDGADLLAMQDSSGEIFVGVRSVCLGIGLSTGQTQRQITNIQGNFILSEGVANLQHLTAGSLQRVLCIHLDYIPLWLAKISITPKMWLEAPELAERLLRFQLKAKDVLAAAFLSQHAAEAPVPRMTDYEIASLLAATPAKNLTAVTAFLQQNGYDILDPAFEAAQDTVRRFAQEILPQCSWEMLPFKFLYDLYKAWLRKNRLSKKSFGRNGFIKCLRQIVTFEPTLQCWRVTTYPVHPGNRMACPEPLAEKYQLTAWVRPAEKTSYKGLVLRRTETMEPPPEDAVEQTE